MRRDELWYTVCTGPCPPHDQIQRHWSIVLLLLVEFFLRSTTSWWSCDHLFKASTTIDSTLQTVLLVRILIQDAPTRLLMVRLDCKMWIQGTGTPMASSKVDYLIIATHIPIHPCTPSCRFKKGGSFWAGQDGQICTTGISLLEGSVLPRCGMEVSPTNKQGIANNTFLHYWTVSGCGFTQH
jgi:hypothetical protein